MRTFVRASISARLRSQDIRTMLIQSFKQPRLCLFVMRGLVPRIPLRDAPCPPKRDGRNESGHDEREHASSARFYDPGASPRHFFPPDRGPGGVAPRKMPGGAERRWTLPSERNPHREPAGSEPVGAGGVRQRHRWRTTTPARARRRSTTRTACAVRAAFAAVSVPGPFPINRRCAGSPWRSFRPWRPAMAGSP